MGRFEQAIEQTYTPKLLGNTDKGLYAYLFDAEIDEFKVTFNFDESVQIETEGLSYLCLTLENLEQLKSLILEAEERYLITTK